MAQIIHQYVVVFGDAGGIVHDPFEDFEETDDLDFEARFFAHLAAQRFFEALSGLDNPAGQRPRALERLAPALDQQDAIVFDDKSSDAQNRAARILAANIATLP